MNYLSNSITLKQLSSSMRKAGLIDFKNEDQVRSFIKMAQLLRFHSEEIKSQLEAELQHQEKTQNATRV